MRYFLLTDIQGNKEALTSCLEDIVRGCAPGRNIKGRILEALKKKGLRGRSYTELKACPASPAEDSFYCLGDIVGYGADPNDCLDLMREIADIVLPGNHEFCVSDASFREDVLDRYSRGQEKEYFRSMWAWNHEVLTEENRTYLEAICEHNPLQLIAEERLLFSHGLPVDPARFLDYSSVENVELYFRRREFRGKVSFMGHTHTAAFMYGIRRKNGKKEVALYPAVPSAVEQNHAYATNGYERLLIAVPSVGQPRDGSQLAGYCVYDSDAQKVYFRRVEYDVEAAAGKILAAGLPEWFAERLKRGT